MSFDWTARYLEADTPWDLGAPHPELVARLADGRLAPPVGGARCYVPGAGRGHDARALAQAGWRVVAVDSAGLLEGDVGPVLAEVGGRFVVGDALDHEDEPFDLVWDHTFFCALDPRERPRFGAMVDRLLASRGSLATLVFPFGKPPELKGPPFGMSAEAIGAALGRGFRLASDEDAGHPVKRRSWGERLAHFVRWDA